MSIPVSATPNEPVSIATPTRESYLTQLLGLTKHVPTGLSWLRKLRDDATARVQEQTFPTTRDEEWRFVDLSPLVKTAFQGVDDQEKAIAPTTLSTYSLPETEQSRLVFIDGIFHASLSNVAALPEKLIVGNLSTLTDTDANRVQPYLGKQSGAEEIFTALNTAGFADAAVVLIPKNVAVEAPIHLLFVTTDTSAPMLVQPRCLVVAEANSAVTLIEDFVTLNRSVYFTNAVTEIWIEENAQVNHTRIQRESNAAFHIGKTATSQARTSRYTCNAINIGAALSRHNLEIYQTGEQTETVLNGLTVVYGDRLADTHSAIALTKPYGASRQLQKCIIGDTAHAVFNGKVFVPKAAQLTDAAQLNRNLLLSPKARVDTKPQLEIVADNVKCTHGATVGQLDTDEIFYLQSRGIDADSARSLLTYAFAYEIIAQIPISSLRQTLSSQVNHPAS